MLKKILSLQLPEISVQRTEKMVKVKKKPKTTHHNWIITSHLVLNYSLGTQEDPLVVEMVQSLHTEKWDSAAPGIASSMTECHMTELCYAAAASADDPEMTIWPGVY